MNKRLYHMAVFAVVVEEGSFAGAARTLERSPSVVSVHVAELERGLDTRLLHRTTRRLALTEAGERYLPHCQAVLEGLRQANALAETMRTAVEGRLCVTAPSALLDLLVMPALQRMLEAHPRVDVQLVDTDSREDLDAGVIDVAIRVGALRELDHRTRRLGDLRDVRVARAQRPDRAIVLPWQDQAPLARMGVLRVSSVAAAHCAVTAGLGWAVLPSPVVRDALGRGELESEGESCPAPVYAVHAFGPMPPAPVRAFIDVAVRVAAAADWGLAGDEGQPERAPTR